MSGGFQDPIVGGQALRIPSIRSPNYLAGSAGWTINVDGSVEFNNGTFRGTVTAGSFVGTDFIINSLGMFFYSGTPAAGNLIAAIAPVTGTDAFGNPYLAGITGMNASTFVSLIGSGIFFGQGAANNTQLNLAGWAKSLTGSDILELIPPFYQAGSVAQSQLHLGCSTSSTNAFAQLLDKSGIAPADLQLSGNLRRTDNGGTPLVKQTPGGSAPLVLNANWTLGAAAIRNTNPLKIWLDANDMLHLSGAVATLNNAPGATVVTVSAPYLPANNTDFGLPQGAILQMTSGGSFKAVAHCFLVVATGLLQINQATFAAGDIFVFDHHWPMGSVP